MKKVTDRIGIAACFVSGLVALAILPRVAALHGPWEVACIAFLAFMGFFTAAVASHELRTHGRVRW